MKAITKITKEELIQLAKAEWSFCFNMGVAFIEHDGRKYIAIADSEQQAIEDVVASAFTAIRGGTK